MVRSRASHFHRAVPALLGMLLLGPAPARADELDVLARDFWAWRAANQPFSQDDITRIDRPAGWRADWSPEAFASRGEALRRFEERHGELDASRWPVARQVDLWLLGSAIGRVRWELEVAPGWRRNPTFYLDQTLGTLFDQLLEPPPFDAERSAEIVRRLESAPETLAHARKNLNEARAPFARLAIEELKDVRPRLASVARELRPLLAGPSAKRLDSAVDGATAALESFRAWLQERLPSMPANTAVGREAYLFFLRRVALLPFSSERLVAMGRQEWERAVAFEAFERNRNRGRPELPLLPDSAAVIDRQREAEATVRRFLEERALLTLPSWLRHYWLRPLPAYLEPLRSLGVTDDLTGPRRLDRDATSYVQPPSPQLGYFELGVARDPRLGIVHEGAHHVQLALSWAHEDPLRRHYYDSGPNEGIAFYNEELMLQAGLFDDSPRSREVLYSMMRLRALRVEVDVKLALGELTIEQAAEYLRTAVPMDAETAAWEAAFYASIPGQAISYQIGKLQVLGLVSDARRLQGDAFSLRSVHDFLWKNGNVPLALQRWELLGLRDQVDALGAR